MSDLQNGFLIVASCWPQYVQSAKIAGASIKDYYPDAHVTLFVPKHLYDRELDDIFDIVVTDEVPDHTRTKLWALSRTPYKNLTVYVDADMECVHEDIQTVWDQIPTDTDVLITKIRPYNGKIAKWDNGEMIYHGGFFMYRNNPHTIELMEKWWVDYEKQKSEPWPWGSVHPISLRPWDQFTLWKLLNIDKMPVKVGIFNDDARWNFVNGYYLTENKQPVIFYHHTVPFMREREQQQEQAKKEINQI